MMSKEVKSVETWIYALSVAAVTTPVVMSLWGSDAYQMILGLTHPIASTLAVTTLGLVGWRILITKLWVPVRKLQHGSQLAVAIGLILPTPVIIVDMLGGFGQDINVPLPDSLLFYPSIALIAEFTFHIVPLAVAAILATRFSSVSRSLRMAGLSIAVIFEPILQVLWGASGSPFWTNAYVGLHLLAFNAVGVYILYRYRFLQVYLYRISYYSVWHITWGYLRLDLLFNA